MSTQKTIREGRLKAAIDTSALISLQLSGLLKKSFRYFSFIIGHTVREELKGLARTRDALGISAGNVLRHIENGDIKLMETQKEERGEEEAIKIMEGYDCDFLISDDIRFVMRKEKKLENIRFSVFIIHILYRMDEISKEEAQKAIASIFEKRKWSENLISLFAKEVLHSE